MFIRQGFSRIGTIFLHSSFYSPVSWLNIYLCHAR